MRWLALTLVAVLHLGPFAVAPVDLGDAFGSASASGAEVGAQTMEVDLQVEVPGGGAVVAHLVAPDGRQQTLALAEREAGVYGAMVELPKADYLVAFEILGHPAQLSRALRLTELGLDPALLGRLPEVPEPSPGGGTSFERWGLLALGLIAGALSLLAFWVFVRLGRNRGRHRPGRGSPVLSLEGRGPGEEGAHGDEADPDP